MRLTRAVGAAGFTVVIYLGLMLAGWGLRDLAGFFAFAPRAGYAVLVMLFALAIGIQGYHSMEGIQDGKGAPGKTVRRQAVIGALLVWLLFAALAVIPFLSRRGIGVVPVPPLLAVVGLALCALGYLLVLWSGLALGRQYSAQVTIQEGHRLVTSGPYRLIRHPRYLGVICISTGITLLFSTWIGLFVTLVLVGLVLSRVYDEETLLSQEFGEEWQQYTRHSWRLVPYFF